MKICTLCKKELSFESFYKTAKSKDGYRHWCKKCIALNGADYRQANSEKEKQRTTAYRKSHPEVARLANRKRNLGNPQKYLYDIVKKRAARLGIRFDIEVADIVIPDVCPVLGIKLKLNEGRLKDDSPSIDKIIPELGYVKGNIAVISCRANRIKNNATSEELMKIARYIEESNGNTEFTRNTEKPRY